MARNLNQLRIVWLVEALELPIQTRIVFLNKEIGAGYICIGETCTNDTVLARWTNYAEGIKVLQAYLAAYHAHPNA